MRWLREHSLLFVLSAIVLLNIIAIILLNNRIAEQEEQAKVIAQPPSPKPVIRTQPLVTTLLLEDPRCPDCFDVRQYIDELNDTIFMNVETANGAAFKSKRLPAIAFNKSLEEYPRLVQGWTEVGYTITIPDGAYAGTWYVLPTINPPYIDDRGVVHGRVAVTYLVKRSCSECYDIGVLKAALNASRITPYKEIILDVDTPEGAALAAHYNITSVPTILMDKEALEYTNLQPGWGVMGTVEPDGTHILRELQRLRVTYYDLASKRLMKP